MPELPEVETIRRTVAPHIIGRTILRATLHRRDVLIVPGDPPGGFSRQRTRHKPAQVTPHDLLIGATVTGILRRGKQLAIIASFSSGQARALGVQLGMTGHLEYAASRRAHTHASWLLSRSGKYALTFSDARRFGSLRAFHSLEDLHTHWAALGPDALTIAADDLARALHASRRPIKAALLDQQTLAGVGNIYADEALFLARINPRTLASRLRAGDHTTLAAAIRHVLEQACLAGGSTLRDFANADGQPGFYQDDHKVYGRSGLPCTACGTFLRAATLAQRTTVWCPSCQPFGKRNATKPT